MSRASLSLSLPLVIAVIASVVLEGAQLSGPSPPASGSTADRLPLFDGPPAPLAPQVATRDDEGRVTIRAVPLTGRIQIDGRLDEEIYATTPAISDFVQTEPSAGAPATEKTELWIIFDRQQVYVSFRCWESQPERLATNDMRRDSPNIYMPGADAVGFMFDTFYDRRSGFLFNVNPNGGRTDGQFQNERQYNGDWNPVWQVEVARFEHGWIVEAAIPFKSLRYQPGQAQVWGFQARRNHAWKGEFSYLTRLPPGRGTGGVQQAGLAATLVGMEVPEGAKNLELKPYATTDLTTDRAIVPAVSNQIGGDVGVDLKYGVGQNLTADFTYNTDFAQVEADEQQVNLTRFSLFFPEKRDFFLENQSTFFFGGIATTGSSAGSSDAPILFYSRRIGLNDGREVPLRAGGRLTGRSGRYSLGLVNLQTGDEETTGAVDTNFTVLRIKRDLFRRSSIGAMLTGRSVGPRGEPANYAGGVDGTFAFYTNLFVNAYWARTSDGGGAGDADSYRGQFDYTGDRYGLQVEHLAVGDGFNPEVGFVRRRGIRRSSGQARFSPRPRAMQYVRKFSWSGSAAYVENTAGRVESRNVNGEFGIELHNSDRFAVGGSNVYEFLPQPFRIAREVTLPVGGYEFGNVVAVYVFGTQRRASGSVTVDRGSFYNGTKTTLALSRGRMMTTSRLSIEPTLSLNWVNLAQGRFQNRLVGSRVTFTATPLMFVSALLQYNSALNALSANIRLRWEYRPGSELFVVYNEQRDTITRGIPDLATRAFIVKLNRLLRF
jgi:hypothetical protein